MAIRTGELVSDETPVQLSFFTDEIKIKKLHDIELLKDRINEKYGKFTLCRGILISDKTLLPQYDDVRAMSTFRSH